MHIDGFNPETVRKMNEAINDANDKNPNIYNLPGQQKAWITKRLKQDLMRLESEDYQMKNNDIKDDIIIQTKVEKETQENNNIS